MRQGLVRNFFEKRILNWRGKAVDAGTMAFVEDNLYPDRSRRPELPTELSVQQKYQTIMSYRGASTLRLNISFPHREALKEAIGMDSSFVEHRKDPNFGWYAVCLHGTSPEQTNDFYAYGFENRAAADYRWTELAERAPHTVAWLKTVWPYDDYFRVRFVKLAPGGYITPHRDTDGERGYFAVNVCLNQPVGCVMVMEGYGIVPWAPGDVRLMDIGLRHAVVNLSNQDRYHLIIHGRAHSATAQSALQSLIGQSV